MTKSVTDFEIFRQGKTMLFTVTLGKNVAICVGQHPYVTAYKYGVFAGIERVPNMLGLIEVFKHLGLRYSELSRSLNNPFECCRGVPVPWEKRYRNICFAYTA